MNQASAKPVEQPISRDSLIRRALSVKNSYGPAFVKTLLTTLFDAPKLMEISADEIPQAYYLLEHIETLKGSHATLPEHVNILLHECPHTVWDTSSLRALETGMADLAGSLINTVAAMCELIEQQRKEIEEVSAKNNNLLNMAHDEHTKVQGLEYERDNTWLPKIAKYESGAGVELTLKGTTSMSLTMTPELEAELVKALSGQTQLMIVAQDHPKTFEEAWARFEAAGYRYGGGALENVRFGWQIAHGLKPRQGADDLATVNAARAMLAPAQLAPVKVAACAECSVAVETLEGVEHYSQGCNACARRFEGDDSARLIKHVEPVAMPAVKLRGKAFPDECVATGQTCSYGPHGRNGEIQCEYCGSAPSAHPQLEHATQESPVVELCPGCGIQETMGGQCHYNLECEACQVRQAAQEARAQGVPIHDLGDDVQGLIEMLNSGTWRPLQVKTHMGHRLIVVVAELFKQAQSRHQLEVDISRLRDELIAEEWAGTASGSDLGKSLESAMQNALNQWHSPPEHDDEGHALVYLGLTEGLGAPDDHEAVIKGFGRLGIVRADAEKLIHALVDSHRLAFLEGRIKEKGAWGASLIFDAAHGGTFCYMHRHYRGAARKNLREVIDFERGINPTLPEFKEPK